MILNINNYILCNIEIFIFNMKIAHYYYNNALLYIVII